MATTGTIRFLDELALPGDSLHKFLTRTSGPAGADAQDMITVSTAITSGMSVFEYEVPTAKIANIETATISVADTSITPTKFGGLAALTNGCLAQLVDTDDSVLIDLTDGLAITNNIRLMSIPMFSAISGTLVRANWMFSPLLYLTAGQKFRWTNRDDLTGLQEFRISIHGGEYDAP